MTPAALASFATLRAAAIGGALPAHIEALESCATGLADGQPSNDKLANALRALAAALRIDLVFLVAYPEALLPALWARCAFHEAPDAGRFWLAAPRLVTGTWLQRWALEWLGATRDASTVWLRALRPPPHGLDGALIAERRGVPFRRPLDVSDDGSEVLLGGNPVDALACAAIWSVRDGSLRSAPPSSTPAPRFTIDTNSPWDAMLVERSGSEPDRGHKSRLFAEPGLQVESWTVASDECSLAALTIDVDCERELHVMTLPGRELQLRVSVDGATSVRFSADGRFVVAAGSSVKLFEIEGGRGGRRSPIRFEIEADEAALSANGRFLVSACAGALQLWDLERPLQSLPIYHPRRRGSDAGLPTAFSPSGARLVSGSVLYHGVSGLPVARLGFERGNYTEGGPPANWFFVNDTRIVALDGGVHSWDTATGIRRGDSRERRFAQWHEVAFRHDGLRFAARRLGDREAQVFRVDDGEPEGAPGYLPDSDWTGFEPARPGTVPIRRSLDGVTELVDGNGEVEARLPHAEADSRCWIGHPDGVRFAALRAHVVVERPG